VRDQDGGKDSSVRPAPRVDEGTSEVFSVLGDETRLAILLALWEAYDPYTESDTLTFSALRAALGSPDSGRFNYHLRKLEGPYVEQTDDGYRLTPTALKLVQTVVAGTGDEVSLPPREVAVACHLCDGPTAITYRNGWFYHVCTACDGNLSHEWGEEGVLFAEPLSPAALTGRTPEEQFAAAVFRLLTVSKMKAGGVCPRCTGLVDATLEVCDAHDTEDGRCGTCGNAEGARIRWVCSVCKYRGGASVATTAATHPTVEAFYHDHGEAVGGLLNEFSAATRYLELLRAHEQEIVQTDPVRVRVTVRHGDDELQLLYDEHLDVVETERNG